MADIGRKGLGEQAQEKMTPDSQKSAFDKVSETATGLGDKAAAAAQPSGEKSTTQKIGDSARGGADDAQSGGKTYVDQASEMASNVATSVSNTLGDAANNISGSTESKK